MAASPMDPQYEQRLRDEVIYLHSLWHQGPPRAPASAFTSAFSRHLQPTKETQFKKEKKRRGKRGKKSKNKPNKTTQEPNSSPGAKWPVPSPPRPPSSTGWPNDEEKPDPKPRLLSPEEQLKLAAKHAHRHAIKVVHEFFRSNDDDDSDAIDSSSEDEDDELLEEDDGREEYSFFFKVYNEDAQLREYYEKNFVNGEFNCLVCGAVGGKKTGKKFNGCLALVQHTITIAKTKRRRAHRALGQAVCKVLGWDIDQLPSIVSLLSDKSGETQGNVNSDNKESSMTPVNNVGSVEGTNGEAVPQSGSIGSGVLPSVDEGDMNPLTCPDADKNLENFGMVHQHSTQEPAVEGLTSNPLPCPGANENLENLGMVHPHNMEEPAAEALTSNSLMRPDADKNLENPGTTHPYCMEKPAAVELANNSLTCPAADQNLENLGIVVPHNVEKPSAEGLSSVPPNEDAGVGSEMQDLQIPYGLK